MATVKLADLLKYPFKEVPFDGYWDIDHILTELRIDTYNLQGEINKSLFNIKKIYDNPHDSDESSYRYLLYFRGKFCCLYGYTGDRGTSTVEFASKEMAKELRNYFLNLEDITCSIIDEEFDLSDHYTTFFPHEGDFFFHIQSPRWSGNFNEHAKNMFYIADTEGNDLKPCTFVKYKTGRMQSWEEKTPDDKIIIVKLSDGTEIEAGYHQLIFLVETEPNPTPEPTKFMGDWNLRLPEETGKTIIDTAKRLGEGESNKGCYWSGYELDGKYYITLNDAANSVWLVTYQDIIDYIQ